MDKRIGSILNNEGLAVCLEVLFEHWRDLDRLNQKVADAWDKRMAEVPKLSTHRDTQVLWILVSNLFY
ncbi:MAG: hypothetical protein B6247_05640 [Candidatus Parabeggiatoa sp. nov. 2]|nr:MAG: hypothetical protein B6247_05640 [Beggiatoa sp. 4572_84]